jgi:hypothetical protein
MVGSGKTSANRSWTAQSYCSCAGTSRRGSKSLSFRQAWRYNRPACRYINRHAQVLRFDATPPWKTMTRSSNKLSKPLLSTVRMSAPLASAVRQFIAFLTPVARKTTAAVVLIAGNQNSGGPDRLHVDYDKCTARTHPWAYTSDEFPLVIRDKHGPVAFSAPPFT